jgi:hypothetical protein
MNQSSRHDNSGTRPSTFAANSLARHATASLVAPFESDFDAKAATIATAIKIAAATPTKRARPSFMIAILLFSLTQLKYSQVPNRISERRPKI